MARRPCGTGGAACSVSGSRVSQRRRGRGVPTRTCLAPSACRTRLLPRMRPLPTAASASSVSASSRVVSESVSSALSSASIVPCTLPKKERTPKSARTQELCLTKSAQVVPRRTPGSLGQKNAKNPSAAIWCRRRHAQPVRAGALLRATDSGDRAAAWWHSAPVGPCSPRRANLAFQQHGNHRGAADRGWGDSRAAATGGRDRIPASKVCRHTTPCDRMACFHGPASRQAVKRDTSR